MWRHQVQVALLCQSACFICRKISTKFGRRGCGNLMFMRIDLLLTYSIVQSPSWAANWFAASQEKFSAFHGIRRFITALTSVRHLSLSWANPIQSIYPHPTSWRSILILSTHLCLGLPSGSFPPVSPPRPYTPPLLTHTRHMSSPSHSSRFYHPHNIGWGVQIAYWSFSL